MGIIERRLLYQKLQQSITVANDSAESIVSDIEKAYEGMDDNFSNRKDDMKETLRLAIEIRDETRELMDKINDLEI